MSLETIVYVTPGVPVYLGQVCSVHPINVALCAGPVGDQ